MSLSSLPPSAVSLLEFFCSRPRARLYSSQVQREAKVSEGAANQGLRLLEGLRLVLREKVGRQFFYFLNRQAAAVKQFKVFGTLFSLRDVVFTLEPFAVEIVLFGSASRGEDDEESDVDLLVICPDKKAALDAFRTAKKGIGAFGDKISPVFATPAEFSAMRRKDAEFYERVRQGIVVFRK